MRKDLEKEVTQEILIEELDDDALIDVFGGGGSGCGCGCENGVGCGCGCDCDDDGGILDDIIDIFT